MSFSTEVKDALIAVKTPSPSKLLSETLGFLLFANYFSSKEMSFSTENKNAADYYKYLIFRISGYNPSIKNTKNGLYTVTVESEQARKNILKAYYYNGNETARRITKENIFKDTEKDFLRGVFLACGNMTDPYKNYHLELSVLGTPLAKDLLNFINDLNAGFFPKIIKRNGKNILYLSDSESITNFLTYIGAQNASVKIFQIGILKTIKNDTNRRTNFEHANIKRMAKAVSLDISIIRKLKSENRFEILPENVKKIGNLRLKNPDLSLTELGECFSPPISRSKINYALRKIREFSNK